MDRDSFHKYAKACANPFDPDARGCGLPYGDGLHSFKTSATLRFEGSTNADGVGLIYFNPSPFNDVAQVWCTNTTSNTTSSVCSADIIGTQIQQSVASGTVVAVANGTDVFQVKSLPHSVVEALCVSQTNQMLYLQARVVAAGAKVTFTGATLTDAGVAYALVEPNHANLSGANFSDFGRYTSCKVQKMAERRDIEMFVTPCATHQKEYSGVAAGVASLTGTEVAFYMNKFDDHGYQVIPAYNGSTNQASTFTNFDQVDHEASTYEMRNYNKICYPLGNFDNDIVPCVTQVTINSITTTGLITYTGTLRPYMDGAKVVLNQESNVAFFRTNVFYVLKHDPLAGTYYLTFPSHSSVTGAPVWNGAGQAGLTMTATVTYYTSQPNVIAACAIQGPSSQAFHVEYIVHCEYTGLNVQGRTSVSVPLVREQSLLSSILHTAREKSGQHERSKVVDHIADAALTVAGKYAPSVCSAVVDAVIPEASPFVEQGLSSLFSFMKKRKH